MRKSFLSRSIKREKMEVETLKFIPSQRGGRIAIYKGFMYTQHKRRAQSKGSTWACVKRENCTGRVHISEDETELREVKSHTHSSDHGVAKAKEKVVKMRKRARDEPGLPTREIIEKCLSENDYETQMSFPKESWCLGATLFGHDFFRHEFVWARLL